MQVATDIAAYFKLPESKVVHVKVCTCNVCPRTRMGTLCLALLQGACAPRALHTQCSSCGSLLHWLVQWPPDSECISSLCALYRVQDRAFNDRRYYIGSSKLGSLGWQERTSWEDGLRKTIEW